MEWLKLRTSELKSGDERVDGLTHKIREERGDGLTLKIDGERADGLTHKIRGERADGWTFKIDGDQIDGRTDKIGEAQADGWTCRIVVEQMTVLTGIAHDVAVKKMESDGTPIGLDEDSQKTGYFSLDGLAGAVGSECAVRNGGMRCSDGAGGFDGFDGVDSGSDGVDGGFDGVDGGSDGFVGSFDGFDGVDDGGSDGFDSLDSLGDTLKWEKLRELSCRDMHGWEANDRWHRQTVVPSNGGGDGWRRWMASMASMVDADGGGLGSSTQRALTWKSLCVS